MYKRRIIFLFIVFNFNFLNAQVKVEAKAEKVFDKKIALLSQWHLLAKNETQDIEQAKKIPQFQNQKAIYLVIQDWIENDRIDVVIAEGCQGEIDRNTRLKFNTWDFWKLYGRKDSEVYADIMTHIPLKIEAKYGEKIKTICGDSEKLLNEHQLVLSEMVGVSGFLFRIKEAIEKNDQKKIDLYKNGYEKLENKKIPNIVSYLEKKLAALEQKEKELIVQRNDHFIQIISQLKDKRIAVVLGARHMVDLEKKLKSFNYEVVNFPAILETLPNQGEL